MVIHDPTLDRTTTGTGPGGGQDRRRAASASPQGPGRRVTAEAIPTLDEVVALAAAGGRRLLLEIKVDAGKARYPGIEERVAGRAGPPRHGRHDRGHGLRGGDVAARARAPARGPRAGALYSARTLAVPPRPCRARCRRPARPASASSASHHSLVTPRGGGRGAHGRPRARRVDGERAGCDADAHRPGDRRPDHRPPGRGDESVEPRGGVHDAIRLGARGGRLGALVALVPAARAQAPIEGELVLITPVSKFIHDAALKAFADYAKEKWNVDGEGQCHPRGHPRGLRAHRRSGRAGRMPTSSGAGSRRSSRSSPTRSCCRRSRSRKRRGTRSPPRSASPSPSR